MNTNDEIQRGVFSVRDFCLWAGIGRTAFYEEIKNGRLGVCRTFHF